MVKQLTDSSLRKKVVPRPKGKNQGPIFDVLSELLKAGKPGIEKAPSDPPSVALSDLIDACKERLTIDPKRIAERVSSAVQSMDTSGVLVFRSGRIWLPSIDKCDSDEKLF